MIKGPFSICEIARGHLKENMVHGDLHDYGTPHIQGGAPQLQVA